MEIVFVRHGTPDYSLADERHMSQLEKDYAPLSRESIPSIKKQSESPVFSGVEIIISSPYTRALQTAEILNRRLGLELFVEHDLREWRAALDGGYLDLRERDRRWHEYRSHVQHGSSSENIAYESALQLKERVVGVLERYRAYKKVVIVSHFNVLESLLGFQSQGIGCAEYKCFNLADINK